MSQPLTALPSGLVVSTTAEPASARTLEVDRLAPVLAVAVVVLLPVSRIWVLWTAPNGDGDLNQFVSTSPLDWPLGLLVALQVASVLEDRFGLLHRHRTGWPVLAKLLVGWLAWLAVCALVHPSWRAVDLAFHVAGVWGLVRTARRSTAVERDVLLGAFALVGAAQAILGIAQSRLGELVGIGLFEFDGPLYTFGSSTAGRASLTHPYHLTALLVTCAAAAGLLAVRRDTAIRTASLIALTAMAVAVPLTFSRAAVLAVVPMVLLWFLRPRSRAPAAVLAGGLVIGIALGFGGISAKADQTVDVDAADSGRRERLAEAWRLMEEEPFFGVGPGRYVIALQDVEHADLLPAHNVVGQSAAEAGVPGGLLAATTVGAFLAWLVRRSPVTIAAGISLLPFHLLDSYPHVFPVGLVITGMWLSTVAIAAEAESG